AIRWARSVRFPTGRALAAASAAVRAAVWVRARAVVTAPVKAAALAAACSAWAAAWRLLPCSTRWNPSTPKKPARRNTRAPCCSTFRWIRPARRSTCACCTAWVWAWTKRRWKPSRSGNSNPASRMARPSRWKRRSKSTSGCCKKVRFLKAKGGPETGRLFLASGLGGALCGLALGALANAAEVLVGVDAGVVAIAPVDANRVVAHRFDGEHFQRRFEQGERIVRLGWARGRAVGAGARGAGALVAQVHEAVIAGVAILPIDLDSFRFGNGDVFGIGG